MSGDWIKFELSTLDKPEVLRISRTLGISTEAVAGWLIRFWGWYGANSVDGVVDGVVVADVDKVLSLPGFAEALIDAKWLMFDTDKCQLTVPNFDRHNGESSKKRALKARRQSKWRAENVDAPVDAPPSPKVLPEKRREENIKTTVVVPEWVPREAWDGFVEFRRKGKAKFTNRAQSLAITELQKLVAAGYDATEVLNRSVMNGWAGLYPINGKESPRVKVDA